jgi:hypothetical protein
MQALLKLLLEHPEAFDKSAVPCCLWGLFPTDDLLPDDHMLDISKPPLPTRPCVVACSH